MGKSLAEQIAEIANKPQVEDFDIENEDAVFQHGGSNSGSDVDSDEEKDELKKQHYVPVGKSKLREAADQGLALKDKKYIGSKGSRASVFNDEDLKMPVHEGDSESELEESDSGVDLDAHSESESESESTSEADSDSEELSDAEDEEEDEETATKKKRLAMLVQKQTKSVSRSLAESVQKDASKGYAIIRQNKFFDKVLDSRIKLQKALSASNQLPASEESWEKLLDEKNTKLLNSTFKILEKVMTQCIAVRHKFQEGDHIDQSETPSSFDTTRKRSFKELHEEKIKLDADLKVYRSAVLNKWSAKVNASSGKSLLQSSKFKSINQSAEVQVENQLADMPRLLKRTKLNRSNVKPLLFEEDIKKGNLKELKEDANKDEDDDEDENPDIPKNYDPRRKDNNGLDFTENPYIYDDEDFYRVLLNDLVEKKIANSQQQGNGITLAITSRSENKLRKNIDTKASKGRKLNYSIQEPIANYEAPIGSGYKWSDEQIDEFFAGLLGQRINFNEDEQSETETTEHNEESEAIKNDDIKIFG
ncbi:protein BFR2 [Kluyveromyces marxianus]|uniref:Protein BFR2 n=2 Tax=Kluyveromyces marxianus TaxID=4911 RepID=W0T7X9_KLUMD|nr:protein BFR2 [Kluyveromyces marxianus DMKU3-1042]QGN15441.1 protein BFR2 [Kluyveromyces marxianus]BAO39727.1 protein BFR2 [Kluyveromyces marxianus DMKU3-1042]BAP71211.1 protein BFR2 [Kluyveromyces marxianus]